MATVGVLAAAGCSVGQGAPDGWRYLQVQGMAVAHPKLWRESGAGAVWLGKGGRTNGALTVASDAPGASGPPADPQQAVPADARTATMSLGGRTARVLDFGRAAPDGRPAAYVEIHVRNRAGQPLLVRAWTVNGASHDSALLQEIVDSIEFPPTYIP